MASPHREPDERAERAIADLLDRLTLEEKLEMLDGDTDFWSGVIDTIRHDAYHRHPWPAGVVTRLGIGGLHFVDGPRGVALEGGATTFPAPIARGASFDVDLEQRIGDVLGRETRAVGANLLGAPCLNLLRHPGWGRAQETYGEETVHLAAMGSALVAGVQRHAIACAKHYALNSIDSARLRLDVRATSRVLHEVYLPQFKAAVDAGAMAVMSAYNSVNGDWCGQNATLLTDILKKRWGFRGFVVTDFLFGVRDAEAGVNAGLDLEMPHRLVLDSGLGEAVAAGRVPRSRIDDAVERMLRAQREIPAGGYPRSLLGCDEHRALARDAAASSIVLLKNSDAALPLPATGTVAMIGRLADEPNLGDRGSSDTRPTHVVTPLAGLKQAGGPELEVTFSTGEDQQRAAGLAARADAAVVVVGLTWRDEGEHIELSDIGPTLRHAPAPDWLRRRVPARTLQRRWPALTRALAAAVVHRPVGPAAAAADGFTAGDRTNLRLDPRDEALVRAVAAANPRTVVVLMAGGAVITESWRHDVAGLVLLWYPGMEGGHALADILLGRVAPSGRMPFTVPTEHAHLPPFNPRAHETTYDLWHGYRLLDRDGVEAAFPFGFGLSYTTFGYDDLVVTSTDDGLIVEVDVTNTGAVAADEVVQVYVEPPGVEVVRPRRQLAGFTRVSAAPGVSVRARVSIDRRAVAYFDEGHDAFALEHGEHRVVIARDAQAAPAASTVVTLQACLLPD